MTLSPLAPVICIPSVPSPPAAAMAAPHLTPMSPITWKQESNCAPSRPCLTPFVLNHLQENLQLRPSAPLSNSFRINKVTNSPQKAPLSNSISFRHFQTSCKAPLSKSFRIIAFQKIYFFRFGLACRKTQMRMIELQIRPRAFLDGTPLHLYIVFRRTPPGQTASKFAWRFLTRAGGIELVATFSPHSLKARLSRPR